MGRGYSGSDEENQHTRKYKEDRESDEDGGFTLIRHNALDEEQAASGSRVRMLLQ